MEFFALLVKGLTWLWVASSIFMTTMAVLANLIGPVSSVFIELMAVTGAGLISAVAALKVTAWIAGAIKLIGLGFKKAQAEKLSKKNS